MRIMKLSEKPTADIADALRQFEEQFFYPLGGNRSFRINHGTDYSLFFRSMGEGASFVGESDGEILGVLSISLRSLLLPNGEEETAAYIGDIKIHPKKRGSATLYQLMNAARTWIGNRTSIAFSIVMDGTTHLPSEYTGRLGIPLFSPLAKVNISRISLTDSSHISSANLLVDDLEGVACYRSLCRDSYACHGGSPSKRSMMKPVWIMDAERMGCGRLEDTSRAKRLWSSDGAEMKSAHLTCFAFQTKWAAAKVLEEALYKARELGFPAVFLALPMKENDIFSLLPSGLSATISAATVFGLGLEPKKSWYVNTSEI